jgi:hypothetical protein
VEKTLIASEQPSLKSHNVRQPLTTMWKSLTAKKNTVKNLMFGQRQYKRRKMYTKPIRGDLAKSNIERINGFCFTETIEKYLHLDLQERFRWQNICVLSAEFT